MQGYSSVGAIRGKEEGGSSQEEIKWKGDHLPLDESGGFFTTRCMFINQKLPVWLTHRPKVKREQKLLPQNGRMCSKLN